MTDTMSACHARQLPRGVLPQYTRRTVWTDGPTGASDPSTVMQPKNLAAMLLRPVIEPTNEAMNPPTRRSSE